MHQLDFALPGHTNHERANRFVALPVSNLNEKLESQITNAQKEVEGLGKKLTSLEITQKNSKEHIDRMLRGSAAAAS